MLSAEDNELLTRSGPGTAMGRVLRSYWQPLVLTAELPVERPLKETRIAGEDLVVFRDESGRYGALERRCAHRAGDLCYGRLEDGGVRCPYHGWLFDVAGRCLDQPAEPHADGFRDQVRQPAFPCVERNGIVYGYLGAGVPPLFPAFDWHLAPDSHIFVFKGYQRCNWVQANEGEIDPAHLSYLHRYLADEIDDDASYGFNQFLAEVEDTGVSITTLLREVPNPRLEVEQTDYGVRIFALRDAGNFMYARITNYVFPNAAVVGIRDLNLVQIHVPIDDESNWRYDIFYSYGAPVDKETLQRGKQQTYSLPDYRPRRNRDNDYLFDAAEQKTGTYAGVGYDFNVHDTCILEGAGAIQDRTREHLGYTDKPIIAARQMLLAAARDEAAPPIATLDENENHFDNLVAIEFVTGRDDWRTDWVGRQMARRQASTWAGKLAPVKLADGLVPGL